MVSAVKPCRFVFIAADEDNADNAQQKIINNFFNRYYFKLFHVPKTYLYVIATFGAMGRIYNANFIIAGLINRRP